MIVTKVNIDESGPVPVGQKLVDLEAGGTFNSFCGTCLGVQLEDLTELTLLAVGKGHPANWYLSSS